MCFITISLPVSKQSYTQRVHQVGYTDTGICVNFFDSQSNELLANNSLNLAFPTVLFYNWFWWASSGLPFFRNLFANTLQKQSIEEPPCLKESGSLTLSSRHFECNMSKNTRYKVDTFCILNCTIKHDHNITLKRGRFRNTSVGFIIHKQTFQVPWDEEKAIVLQEEDSLNTLRYSWEEESLAKYLKVFLRNALFFKVLKEWQWLFHFSLCVEYVCHEDLLVLFRLCEREEETLFWLTLTLFPHIGAVLGTTNRNRIVSVIPSPPVSVLNKWFCFLWRYTSQFDIDFAVPDRLYQ